LLEQLAEPDRAREAGRAGADDEDADLDALVRRIARRCDRLGGRERRRVVARPDPRRLPAPEAHARRAFTSLVNFGTTCCRSPTTPRPANSKIGAVGCWLMATIVPAPCLPPFSWLAPEVPQARSGL